MTRTPGWAYQAMSLDEKTADFNARCCAGKRAEERGPLRDPDRSPENLLSALQDELKAERGMFSGNKTWEKMLFDQAKRDEQGLSYLLMSPKSRRAPRPRVWWAGCGRRPAG